MFRKISLIVIPVLGLAGLTLLFPNHPVVQKAGERARDVAAWKWSDPDRIPPIEPSDAPRFVPPAAVTLGPEYAQMPEIRVWAIRNATTYGWVQLPRGTSVELIRSEGEYLLIRYEETVMRVHRSLAESGVVVPKARKGRTYAVAY